MSKVTSAVANKLLKKYNEDLQRLYQEETACSTYTEVEGIKPIIPDYSFMNMRSSIADLMYKIQQLKHDINVFNTTTVLPNAGITIDEALVRMSMLTKEKDRLHSMIVPIPKRMKTGFGARDKQIEYDVVNYDVSDARKQFDLISEQLTSLQLELDIVNSTETFEVAD